jgi:hypothetical protein
MRYETEDDETSRRRIDHREQPCDHEKNCLAKLIKHLLYLHEERSRNDSHVLSPTLT